MEYRRFGDTIVLRLDKGEEICESLMHLAKVEHIALAEINGLGAVDEMILGVFDHHAQRYIINPYSGPHEITSLVGTITSHEGVPYLHLHMSAGDIHGNVYGGHLNHATISITGEIVVRILPGTVERRLDTDLGINLMAFD